MPRKKTPTDNEVSAETTSLETPTPKRIRKPRTASASTATKGKAAQKDKTVIAQAAEEIEAPAAAVAEQNSQICGEQWLQSAVSLHEQIALLAYSYWQSRGCQGGSPEEDWYRAEREIRNGRGEAL